MIMRPRSIAVVAYGQPELLAKTLAPMRAEQVVVVDNSSSDEVRAVAMSSGARYVDPGENLGFARGVNRAVAELGGAPACGDLLLLNPDAVIEPAGLDQLQQRFTDPQVAAVSPSLSSPDGTTQQVGWPFPAPRAMWRESLLLPDRRPGTEFVVGAVLMLRAEAIVDVGLMDERYFLYAEETDWQLRASRCGWTAVVADEVVAEHVGAATSGDSRRRDELFHAGQETFVRKWFGKRGWASYRLAVLLGSTIRTVLLRGDQRRSAARRVRIYLRGPRRVAFGRTPGLRRIAHVVVTGNAAGTERYVARIAAQQARQGLDVTVVGGDRSFMAAELPEPVRWLPGSSLAQAAASVLRAGRQDVVHSHLTAADLVASATKPLHGGRVVSTRHIAKSRGEGALNRFVAKLAERGIDREIAISHFVASAIGRPSTVIHNGVDDSTDVCDSSSRRILLAQRLEREKQTDVALRAWQQSGLGADGWTLVVCGEGTGEAQLRAEFDDPSVLWQGWVGDIRSEMRRSAALLAPAPAEPFGLSVLEAMSIGLPVIAAAGGGHLETIGAVDGALLFTPGDVAECAATLTAFARLGEAHRAELGELGQQMQRARFTASDHLGAVLTEYATKASP